MSLMQKFDSSAFSVMSPLLNAMRKKLCWITRYGTVSKKASSRKTYSVLDVVRTHSNATTEGRFVVSFCCMTILNELYRRMRKETIVTSKKEQVKVLGHLDQGSDV